MMKLRIEKYSFGRMTVGGREFRSDLIIYPDGRIQEGWWRTQGHRLVPEDIPEVLEAGPGMLIIGTGASGLMSVSKSLLELCGERGIKVVSCRTAEAVKLFNEIDKNGTSVAACFHLTC